MLQEVHLQHVEGAVDVGGLPENQRRQATRKLHAAMASCWERRGGGGLKRQAELEKAFTEKARQCVPAPRALATRKNRGTATRPAFRMRCCLLACVNSGAGRAQSTPRLPDPSCTWSRCTSIFPEASLDPQCSSATSSPCTRRSRPVPSAG